LEEKEKIIDKIKKLLKLAQGTNFEAESQKAMLLAQKLLAENGLEMEEIDSEGETREVENGKTGITVNTTWKRRMAGLITENFRCQFYMNTRGRTHYAVFLGFKEDVEIAKTIFQFALNVAEKGANRCYRDFKRDGYNTKGIHNDYLWGFYEGLKEKFIL